MDVATKINKELKLFLKHFIQSAVLAWGGVKHNVLIIIKLPVPVCYGEVTL